MGDLQELVRFYKALADETRLRLIKLLTQQEQGHAFCVTRLAQILDVTPSSVSQHLRVLKDLGLVQRRRARLRVHYFLDQQRLASYQSLVRKTLGPQFCQLGWSPDPECEKASTDDDVAG